MKFQTHVVVCIMNSKNYSCLKVVKVLPIVQIKLIQVDGKVMIVLYVDIQYVGKVISYWEWILMDQSLSITNVLLLVNFIKGRRINTQG